MDLTCRAFLKPCVAPIAVGRTIATKALDDEPCGYVLPVKETNADPSVETSPATKPA